MTAVATGKYLHYKYDGVTDKINVYSDGSVVSEIVATYAKSGSYTFTPTVTGTYDISIYGASGGGGGGSLFYSHRASGGDGGNSYLKYYTTTLTAGSDYALVVGSKGLKGVQFDFSSCVYVKGDKSHGYYKFPYKDRSKDSTNGTDGTYSSFNGVVAEGGSGGNKGYYTITWDQEDGYDITSHWGSNIVPKDGNGLAGGLGTNVDYESYEKPNPIPDSRSVKDGLDGKIIISLRKGVPIKIGSTSGYLAITETYNTKSSRMHYKKADGTVCYVAKTV